MPGYTREFLLEAYASRFEPLGLDAVEDMYQLGKEFYDKVGRDKFRVYASLNAEAVRLYKNKLELM